MLLEVLLFFFLGFFAGVLFGLVPGLHPNTVVLLVPLFAFFEIGLLPLLAFVVSMAVSNAVVDFVPSIMLGAPDPGTEMSVLPGHKMLLEGRGYEAVKLAVVGSLGAVVLVSAMLPLLIVAVPPAYSFLRHFIHILLVGFSAFMLLAEKWTKTAAGFIAFLFSGVLGMLSFRLPVDGALILFPVLAGFFGLSSLVFQMKKKSSVPKQGGRAFYVSRKSINVSVLKGAAGGVLSGFLPGVGSSQIAAAMSSRKDEASFLVSIGAISAANIFLSLLSLWLIGRPRSGAAVVVHQLYQIGFGEFLFIAAAALLACGLAVPVTLFLCRRLLGALQRVNYQMAAFCVAFFIFVLTFAFTGLYGLLVLVTCAAFGVVVVSSGIKRGAMMGALVIPAILFYAGL